METQEEITNESFFLFLGVLAGVIVAAVLAPWDDYFLANFMFYWIPQAVILGVLMSVSSRPAAVAGTAIILAFYLAAYWAWLHHVKSDDAGLAWLGYLFSLPGAAVGALFGASFIERKKYKYAKVACLILAASTLVGLALNQLLICSTVMYCRL
ncbi:MAG: hypothetical protein ABL906_10515 [Sideroxydans sp.]